MEAPLREGTFKEGGPPVATPYGLWPQSIVCGHTVYSVDTIVAAVYTVATEYF